MCTTCTRLIVHVRTSTTYNSTRLRFYPGLYDLVHTCTCICWFTDLAIMLIMGECWTSNFDWKWVVNSTLRTCNIINYIHVYMQILISLHTLSSEMLAPTNRLIHHQTHVFSIDFATMVVGSKKLPGSFPENIVQILHRSNSIQC